MMRRAAHFAPVVAVAALVAMVGCAPPLLEKDVAAQLSVRSVQVDTAAITGVVGRDISVTPEAIDADLTAALQQQLRLQPTGRADVSVEVTRVQLISRGRQLALGGTSFVEGILRVTDAASGRDVLPPTRIIGASERIGFGGIIGAVTAPTAARDYQQTIAGFAANVAKRLFTGKPARKPGP